MVSLLVTTIFCCAMPGNATRPGDPDELSPLERLARTLLLVLALQITGYTFKRSGIMPADRAAGLGFFVANIALPCLLFRSIATLDVSVIDGAIVGAVVLAKIIIFGAALGLGKGLTPRGEAPGTQLVNGGLYALCCTMSDDIGLGLPLLSSLFPAQAPLLFFLSALQACIFNTFAFICLGLGQTRGAAASNASRSTLSVVLSVLGNLRKNFLILGLVIGLLYRVTLGPEIPWFIDRFTTTFGMAFTPLVLYLAGCASVGNFGKLASLQSAVLPAGLAVLQSVVLPVLCRIFTGAFGGSQDAQGFAFVYGILPCANSALVIAQSYHLSPPLITTVASYLALGKMLAYPYLFLSAVVLSLTSPEADEGGDDGSPSGLLALRRAMANLMLSLTVLGAAWLLCSAILIPCYRRCPLRRPIVLVCIQGVFGVINLIPELSLPETKVAYIAIHAFASFVRWAINGYVVVMGIDQARKALVLKSNPPCGTVSGCGAAGTCRRVTAKDRLAADEVSMEVSTDKRVDLGIDKHLAFAVALGLCMTLPWSLGCEMPRSPCLLLYLPYAGSCAISHKVAYTSVYAAIAVILVGSLVTVLAAARSRKKSASAQGAVDRAAEDEPPASPPPSPPSPPPSPPPAELSIEEGEEGEEETCTPSTLQPFVDCNRRGMKLRVRFLLATFALHCILSAVFVASVINGDGDNDEDDSCKGATGDGGGSSEILLLLLVLLVDGQGAITFALFGFQPELLSSIASSASRLKERLCVYGWLRQMCCMVPSVQGDASDLSGDKLLAMPDTMRESAAAGEEEERESVTSGKRVSA